MTYFIPNKKYRPGEGRCFLFTIHTCLTDEKIKGISYFNGGIQMLKIPSSLENQVLNYSDAKRNLSRAGFLVGGNWDYRIGYFDYLLGGKHQDGNLRIPFQVHKGSIEDKNGVIRFGAPMIIFREDRYEKLTSQTTAAQINLKGNEIRDYIYIDQFLKGVQLVKEAEKLLLEASLQVN